MTRTREQLRKFWDDFLDSEPEQLTQEQIEEANHLANDWHTCAISVLAPEFSEALIAVTQSLRTQPYDEAERSRREKLLATPLFLAGCRFSNSIDAMLDADDDHDRGDCLHEAREAWLEIERLLAEARDHSQ